MVSSVARCAVVLVPRATDLSASAKAMHAKALHRGSRSRFGAG